MHLLDNLLINKKYFGYMLVFYNIQNWLQFYMKTGEFESRNLVQNKLI